MELFRSMVFVGFGLSALAGMTGASAQLVAGTTSAPAQLLAGTTGASVISPFCVNITPGALEVGRLCSPDCAEACQNVTDMYQASKKLADLTCPDPANPKPGTEQECKSLLVPFGCCVEGRCGTAEQCNQQVASGIDQIEEAVHWLLGAGLWCLVLIVFCLACCLCCLCAMCAFCCGGGKKGRRGGGGGHGEDDDDYGGDDDDVDLIGEGFGFAGDYFGGDFGGGDSGGDSGGD
eukprot:TRINITY_DN100820_c0_g1_i1.p1 TRINITY_DN100820_c0_g1~~TRINITY_DN100820_c0_g1_i1.p1  ORF type:complete len:234 (-),score=41.23 TRINITY_DN100820_c0_g1_i1:135-836(-)